MAVDWTPHRFSGGVLALDTANTVVLRGDPRGFDRFDDPAEIAALCRGGAVFRADELGGRRLDAADAAASRATVHRDPRGDRPRCFAAAERRRADAGRALSRHAGRLRGRRSPARASRPVGAEGPVRRRPAPLAFEAALAVSALSLLPATPRGGSGSAPTAAGCSSTAAATAAGFGATWRCAATARRQGATTTAQATRRRMAMRDDHPGSALAAPVHAGRSQPRRSPPAATPAARASISEIAGKLFVFNYRVATATYLVNAEAAAADARARRRSRPSRTRPAARRSWCARRSGRSWRRPRSRARRCAASSRTGPMRWRSPSRAGRGKVLQTDRDDDRPRRSTRTILPDRPLVVGPVYTPNPELAGHPDGKLPQGTTASELPARRAIRSPPRRRRWSVRGRIRI